jgi:hypothetical protein
MFTVSYTESNSDNSGSVGYELATLLDVVTTVESSFGVSLSRDLMISLMKGESIQAGNLDLWLTESN